LKFEALITFEDIASVLPQATISFGK
jgi:hypothetical protein